MKDHIDEFVDYVLSTQTRGVWFWNTGGDMSPQTAARRLAAKSGVRVAFTAETFNYAMHDEKVTEHSLRESVQTACGLSYEAGGVCMASTIVCPYMASEMGMLLREWNLAHEWYDRVSYRHDKFFLLVDASRAKGIDDLSLTLADTDWARRLNLDASDIKRKYVLSMQYFSHARIETNGRIVVTREAPC